MAVCHRERVRPEQAGIARSGKRRVPGLSREEVAWAAEIGITWYTWLEQGRPIKIAEKTLDRIASVLKLDGAENEYLHRLARPPADVAQHWQSHVTHGVRQLVEGYRPGHASVVTPSWDILTWNPSFGALLELNREDEELERNALWIMFTRSCARRAFPEWREIADQMVAIFRLEFAGYSANEWFANLIETLSRESKEFVAAWTGERVLAPQHLDVSAIRDPVSGRVERFETVNVPTPDGTGQRMVFSAPISLHSAREREEIGAGL